MYWQNTKEWIVFKIGNNLPTYIMIAIAAVVILFSVYVIFKEIIKSRQKRKRLLKELDQPAENLFREESAVVLSKHCDIKTFGYKQPQHRKEFFVVFQTADGKEITYSVLESVYRVIEENQTGTLLTSNGHFYGFSPDTKETR